MADEQKENKIADVGVNEAWAGNIKRTYDAYQDLDLQKARQTLVEQAQINAIAAQALQNAVETANMVSKQAVRHGDIAIDCQWDPGPGEESLAD